MSDRTLTLYIIIDESGTCYGLRAQPVNYRAYSSEAAAKAQIEEGSRTKTIWEVVYDPEGEADYQMSTSNGLRVGDRVCHRRDAEPIARGTIKSILYGNWETVIVEWDDGNTSPYFSQGIVKVN